ncbi:chorismate mutase [Streptomyces oryzae]|uniref:Chorismate mutase n=1 Tax=Streptomyces oryzae TaxID=1434886 RepID=A0ABS3XK87_9ACTN|nr:chorismate mutase [Streptomyces oryzae]MBO8195813.1 chorismate mutase [Streptomyces oryzae]
MTTSTSTEAAPAPEAVIAAQRSRIDALDARLIALVRERMAVSESIQRTRIESGGLGAPPDGVRGSVHLSREMEILDHYSTELGAPGRELARTLLRLCRGH